MHLSGRFYNSRNSLILKYLSCFPCLHLSSDLFFTWASYMLHVALHRIEWEKGFMWPTPIVIDWGPKVWFGVVWFLVSMDSEPRSCRLFVAEIVWRGKNSFCRVSSINAASDALLQLSILVLSERLRLEVLYYRSILLL